MRLLENKVALITGAGRGIGRVIAERFVQDGATVYVNDLQEGDMQVWADEYASRNGGESRACLFRCDGYCRFKGWLDVYI